MGATESRPATELVPIEHYSELIRSSEKRLTVDWICFRGLRWDVTVRPMSFNEETGVSDYLIVGVLIGLSHSFESALGTDISIEILDKTGLYTVFHRESSRGTTQEATGCLLLGVRRSELEASSCINVDKDSFVVRYTLKEQQRPSLLQNWFSSKSKKQPPIPEVAMARSHKFTVDSLSQVKASLLSFECVHSTRFTVGGCRWYLKLSPALAVVRLVRATKEDDETRTRAECSFVLEGAVNAQSGKMTHTFDRDSPDCEFAYQQPEEPTTSMDPLVVRCCVKVFRDVVPSAVPAATIPAAAAIPADVPPPGESVLTPLLSAIHG